MTTDSPLTPPLLAIISSSNAHENARVRVWTLYYTSCIPCCTYCLSWSQGLFREFLILSRTRINTTYPYPQRRMGRSDMSSSTLEHLAPSFSRQTKLRAFCYAYSLFGSSSMNTRSARCLMNGSILFLSWVYILDGAEGNSEDLLC